MRYLLSWIAVLVPGAAAIALAYSLGCILAWELFHPSGGHVHPWHMLESAGLHDAPPGRDRRASSLLASSLSSERGRALSWAAGLVIGSYAWNFLLSLVSSLRPLARLSPWWYYAPGSLIDAGRCRGSTAACCSSITLATGGLALAVFVRRDLA